MSRTNVLPLPAIAATTAPERLVRASLLEICEDGFLRVQGPAGEFRCDCLDGATRPAMRVGDCVLALAPDGTGVGVVIGRIVPYRPPQPEPRLTLEATEVLTLKCGDATLDLRADGKAVLKGEDVLIRATGLQRIKAGSVSIN